MNQRCDPTGVQGHSKKLVRDNRQQARAYVWAHGGCPDNIPADEMRNIEIMFSDGAIGNKGILLALSTLTTGNLNSKLKQGVKAFTIKDVLPSAHEYIIPPLTDEEQKAQTNRGLLAMMAMAPNAPESFRERVSNVADI